jgi:hypothetical protein
MLAVQAPDTPGRYVLEVDVVHELVSWFECDVRMPVTVAPYAVPADGALIARPGGVASLH